MGSTGAVVLEGDVSACFAHHTIPLFTFYDTLTHRLSGRHRLQLLGDRTARYSPFCFTIKTTPFSSLIGQGQYIALNRPCSTRISDIAVLLRPAVRITASADKQFPQSIDDPSPTVLATCDLRTVRNSHSSLPNLYLFSSELVMIRIFGHSQHFTCQETDLAGILLAV